MKKKKLIEALAAKRSKHQEMLAQASDADLENAQTHLAALDTLEAEIKVDEAELAALEALEARAKKNEAERARQQLAGRSPASVHNNEEDRPFRSFGEFLHIVARAERPGAAPDPRLQALAATGSNESVGSDGGYLVGTDTSAEIMKRAYEAAQLAGRCADVTIGANSNGTKINGVDEDSRQNGSRWGGVRAYWAAEAATVAASSIKWRRIELELKKLLALYYATDEVLTDSTTLESEIMQAVPNEIAFMVDNSIFEGDGVGKPLGFMTSPTLVTVSKKSGQAADTVVAENITAMWARMWAPSRRNAVWLINQEVEGQLPLMNVGQQPVYLPPGGLNTAGYGLLLGRPVLTIEHANALGDAGDIVLADFSQYKLARKGGIQAANSMHVRFLYDEQVYRFTYRVDGQPAWKKALTPFKGNSTLSPFVTLESRT